MERCFVLNHLQCARALEILSLKESVEERHRFIRDSHDLVRCLTIEFGVELRLRPPVVPIGKTLELAPSQAPLREGGTSNGDAHLRRLPGDPRFVCDRSSKMTMPRAMISW
jgi:hypothetical protein